MKTEVTLPPEGPPQPSPQATGAEEAPKPVHLNFSKTDGRSPFQKAKNLGKRLKLFLWGDAGVGKTTLALKFPKPVLIDMEGGADHYGEKFDFEVLRAVSADEVMEAVDWLLLNHHDHRTLVIDPITIYWEALQRKWSDIFLKRNKNSKGYRFEYYDMQPRDWSTVKAEFKELIRKLITLDMNVLVTAREKIKYREGTFMSVDGETFDAEKSLPYLFDTIVRLFKNDQGHYMALCLKDRSGKIPAKEFPAEYSVFEGLFGQQALTRLAQPLELATHEQKQALAAFITQFKLTPDQVSRRLVAYEADSLETLTKANADLIIQKFQAAAAKAAATS